MCAAVKARGGGMASSELWKIRARFCKIAIRRSRVHGGVGNFPSIMADKTLFEKIRDHEIPAAMIHQDDRCLAFRDIAPQAPVHVLIVPTRPIPRVGMAESADQDVLGHLLLVAAEVARREGIAESGYRLVINNGPDGGEAVPHLHVHLLGGRKLEWPPG
jgi:histidine triad (HIT) family protein